MWSWAGGIGVYVGSRGRGGSAQFLSTFLHLHCFVCPVFCFVFPAIIWFSARSGLGRCWAKMGCVSRGWDLLCCSIICLSFCSTGMIFGVHLVVVNPLTLLFCSVVACLDSPCPIILSMYVWCSKPSVLHLSSIKTPQMILWSYWSHLMLYSWQSIGLHTVCIEDPQVSDWQTRLPQPPNSVCWSTHFHWPLQEGSSSVLCCW